MNHSLASLAPILVSAAVLTIAYSASASSRNGAATLDSGQIDAVAVADVPCPRCRLCTDADVPTVFEQTLIDLPAQTWFEAPNSHMREVCVPDSLGVRGVMGCRAIVTAWSGGAYDTVRRRMLIWGGGHNDYWGNELYGFDLRSGTWSRVTEPSLIPEGTPAREFLSQDPLPDGKPVSRHTYDGVEFLPDLGVLWSYGGSIASSGGGTRRTWVFDASSGWSQHADGPKRPIALATAYDPSSRQVIVHSREKLHTYHVDTDTWTKLPGWGAPPLWPRYAAGGDKTGVVDPTRGLYWTMGGKGNILVWDVAAAAAVTDEWVTTGGGEYSNVDFIGDRPDQIFESGGGNIYNVPAPGVDYDSAADALVAWPNRGAPYALDLKTKVWGVGEPSGAPISNTAGGTFGRWRYLAAYNVFILVTSVDENVYFYKHTGGCGPK